MWLFLSPSFFFTFISLDIGCMSLFLHARCPVEVYWASSLLILILFILCRLCIGGDRWWGWSRDLRDFDTLSPSLLPSFISYWKLVMCQALVYVLGEQPWKKTWPLVANNTHQSRGEIKGSNGHWECRQPGRAVPDLVDRTFLRPLPADLLSMVKDNVDALTDSTLAFLHFCRCRCLPRG